MKYEHSGYFSGIKEAIRWPFPKSDQFEISESFQEDRNRWTARFCIAGGAVGSVCAYGLMVELIRGRWREGFAGFAGVLGGAIGVHLAHWIAARNGWTEDWTTIKRSTVLGILLGAAFMAMTAQLSPD